MDIICVDANLKLDKKPSRPTYDPLGKLWDVSHHYKTNTVKTDKIQNIEVGIRLAETPTRITTEDAHITCDPLATEFKQDIVYNNGKFVDLFTMPQGRHYFKVFNDDIEYLGEDKKKMAKCHWCSNEVESEVNLPWFEDREREETDLFDCGCRGFD